MPMIQKDLQKRITQENTHVIWVENSYPARPENNKQIKKSYKNVAE